MKNAANRIIPIHQTRDPTGTDGLSAGNCSIPCTVTAALCDMVSIRRSVSSVSNEGSDLPRLKSVYTLSTDGIGIGTGISSRKSAISHNTTNVIFGSLWISAARTTATARIKTAPERLISSKVISVTPFQRCRNPLLSSGLSGKKS